jgi:hypothetical protein
VRAARGAFSSGYITVNFGRKKAFSVTVRPTASSQRKKVLMTLRI